MDKQEAETSIGKPLGPLVDHGCETELFEEYRKSWAGHTAPYDDYLGHPKFELYARVQPWSRGEEGGKLNDEPSEDCEGGGGEERMNDGDRNGFTL